MELKMSIFILCIVIISGCSDKKVEITNEYIINEYWSKRGEEIGNNSINIYKMIVKKDSTIDPNSDLSQAEILEKLEEDSSFQYYTNVKIKEGENYQNKRIYFNRDNGFYWGIGNYLKGDSAKTIGNLRQNSWYKFEVSGYTNIIYIYIDSTGKAHRFNVNLSNY